MRNATEDNDARAQIVILLHELATEHATEARSAQARGDLATADVYTEVAIALRGAASAIEARRGVLFTYELASRSTSAGGAA